MIAHFLFHQLELYSLIIAANIIHDGIQINYYKRSPKHTKNVVIACLIAGAIAMLFCLIAKSSIYTIPFGFFLLLRMWVHDPLLNLLTGKKANYVGQSKDKDEDSTMDNFFEIDTTRQYYFKGLITSIIIVICIILLRIIQFYLK